MQRTTSVKCLICVEPLRVLKINRQRAAPPDLRFSFTKIRKCPLAAIGNLNIPARRCAAPDPSPRRPVWSRPTSGNSHGPGVVSPRRKLRLGKPMRPTESLRRIGADTWTARYRRARASLDSFTSSRGKVVLNGILPRGAVGHT